MRTQDAASAGTNQRPGFRSGGAAQPITGQGLTSDLGLGPAQPTVKIIQLDEKQKI